nr:helix-turn-helix domain-containing protein [Kribbella sandramycini]
MSVADVARSMGMSEMTLYRAIAAGEFPAVRIGRRLLVPARVLERMAELAISTGREVSAAEISGQAS